LLKGWPEFKEMNQKLSLTIFLLKLSFSISLKCQLFLKKSALPTNAALSITPDHSMFIDNGNPAKE